MKKLSINKSNYVLFKFGDVVFEPKEVEKDSTINKIEHVVGLEHLEQENIHLKRFLSMDESVTFKKKFSIK